MRRTDQPIQPDCNGGRNNQRVEILLRPAFLNGDVRMLDLDLFSRNQWFGVVAPIEPDGEVDLTGR